MAVTVIFDGELPASSSGPTTAVEVPESTAYTLSIKGSATPQFSLDDVKYFELNATGMTSVDTGPTGVLARRISGLPVKYVRVRNNNDAAESGVVVTICSI